MRKLLMLSLVALLAPITSQAQVSLGLRLGYAPAMGDAAKDQKMSDGVKAQIPIQLDAAYKVTPDIAVGGYFSYGLGQLSSDRSDACDAAGEDCSANVMRFGVQGLYTFNQVKAPLVPWAGVGIGYERGTLSEGDLDLTYSGFEFLNLQVGGDYKVNEQFAVGPYLQFSVGQYSTVKMETGGASASTDIEETAMHQWFGFGLRGKFDL